MEETFIRSHTYIFGFRVEIIPLTEHVTKNRADKIVT